MIQLGKLFSPVPSLDPDGAREFTQLTQREPIRSWMCGSPRNTQRSTFQDSG